MADLEQEIPAFTFKYVFIIYLTNVNQKQPLEVFYEKAVLKNFALFTEKHRRF